METALLRETQPILQVKHQAILQISNGFKEVARGILEKRLLAFQDK